MYLETVDAPGLAHLSYLLGDEDARVAAVIDPRRDVDAYLDLARRHEVRITHVLETHIHADFVSGSRELAARTAATLYLSAEGGPDWQYAFAGEEGAVLLRHGDTVRVGGLELRAIHTPGHTPEHLCFLVGGGVGATAPWGLFSGDILFAGEVGRPDLLGGGTEVPLARQLFHSLHQRVLPVGDEVEVYPAHGKGSPCGANIGDRRTTTIGYERSYNPRLQTRDEDTFVREILGAVAPAPSYYPRMKRVNREGPAVVGGLPTVEPLDPLQFQEALRSSEPILIDTREIIAFGGAHIAGALNIALREPFPIWAGWFVEPGRPILLVLADSRDLDTVQRHLLRIGLEDLAGWLAGGMAAWTEAGLPFERTRQIGVHELRARIDRGAGPLQVLDVRSNTEWGEGHIPTARHIPLAQLPAKLDALDRDAPVATYCGSGYRASIAASLLERGGFRDVASIPGSMKAWTAADYPLEGGAREEAGREEPPEREPREREPRGRAAD